jgi:hypothetical protein
VGGQDDQVAGDLGDEQAAEAEEADDIRAAGNNSEHGGEQQQTAWAVDRWGRPDGLVGGTGRHRLLLTIQGFIMGVRSITVEHRTVAVGGLHGQHPSALPVGCHLGLVAGRKMWWLRTVPSAFGVMPVV